MKKAILGLVLATLFLVGAGCTATRENNGPLVGGDRDEHGCIGSAGYMWCAPKQKCLRVWEEACYTGTAQEIQYILADKYHREPNEVVIKIIKEDAEHAAGMVKYGLDTEGSLFLAVKIDNVWELVYQGNGSVDCKKMRTQYHFPDEILKPNFCD